MIARVQLHPLPLHDEIGYECELLEQALRPRAYYYPQTRGVCIENTHNRRTGAILPLKTVQQIGAWCRVRGIFFHCDGARLWNAAIATGISLATWASPCTTVMVCLSKGLGAPIGSLLVGPKDIITEARRWRKMLGGGMRQSGMLAAAGLYALDHHIDRIVEDHHRARKFATAISDDFELMLDPPPTNIVLFRSRYGVDSEQLRVQLASRGVLLSSGAPGWLRAVFHLDVHDEDITAATTLLLRTHAELRSSTAVPNHYERISQ